MRNRERVRDRGGAEEPRELHAERPADDRGRGARRARERGDALEQARDARVRAKPPRQDEPRRRRAAVKPKSAKTGHSGDRAGRRRDDDERRERERARGRERRVDAAARPHAARPVDRLRAERDLHRVAELRGRERVHRAADAEPRCGLARADAAARGRERRAPGDRRVQTNAGGECREREREPTAVAVRQSRQRRAQPVPEQGRDRGQTGERGRSRAGGEEGGASDLHDWAFSFDDALPRRGLVGKR